ncbi:MAG: HU family DNA-binding protein [Candidatus Pacebacteria bacterium]|nr:HU family DNA-binding protein [Candidatus Paceibacterota bacterium]
MRKEDLVEVLLKKIELKTKKQAQEAVEIVFNEITNALKKGDEVAISGFGIFKVVKAAARMGINPKTGQKIQIAAATKPKFRAAKALKEAVK